MNYIYETTNYDEVLYTDERLGWEVRSCEHGYYIVYPMEYETLFYASSGDGLVACPNNDDIIFFDSLEEAIDEGETGMSELADISAQCDAAWGYERDDEDGWW